MQLAILVAALLSTVVSQKDPTARVHDFANLLSAEQRASLEDLSRSVERQHDGRTRRRHRALARRHDGR